ncbi:MAG: HAMP domain-containing protein, partial [Methylococcales bacterium]|nr:HAMP domain-containing protein [Methylococcales bacterium]
MILFIILIGTLDLMSSAIQNTDNANSGQYSSLLFINGIGLFILISLIAANFFKMAQQCRYRVPGAKLTLRMGLVFVVVALVPVSVVYYYSLQFLNRGIDSWFDVRIEEGLQNALDLSRASLDLNIAEHKRQTEEVIESVVQLPENMLAINLGEWRAKYNASEMTLFTNTGKAVASSNVNQGQILPTRLSEETLFHLGLGNDYFKLETIREEGMHIRIIVHDPSGGSAMLQAIFPVPKRIETLADSVKTVFTKHRERVFLHNALKDTFTVTLSLVLLFSILFAVWAAFYSAKRMVAPILDLVEGTRAVSAGIYDKQLVSTRNDDLGGLVQAFNDMTKRLAQARNESQRAQQKVESQRAYLQVVLSNLSSGVITFDLDLRFRTSNDAASEILGIDLKLFRRSSIQKIVQVYPSYSNLFWPLQEHMITSEKEWSEQLEIFGAGKRQVLICRSTALPDGAGIQSGYVVVFDDITNLIQAQRNSAWGEVARRLAHEIKNP